MKKTPYYRLRVGNIRLIYEIQDEIILIYFYLADYRGNIYGHLKKRE